MTQAEQIRTRLEEDNPEALFADGFDSAILGAARRCGQPTLVAYSVAKCIKALVAEGMSHEDAVDYFEFNVVGAWVGPHTPVFVYDVEDD